MIFNEINPIWQIINKQNWEILILATDLHQFQLVPYLSNSRSNLHIWSYSLNSSHLVDLFPSLWSHTLNIVNSLFTRSNTFVRSINIFYRSAIFLYLRIYVRRWLIFLSRNQVNIEEVYDSGETIILLKMSLSIFWEITGNNVIAEKVKPPQTFLFHKRRLF